MRYFTVFCRLALALAFLISGMVKVRGERFAAGLPVNNPMGHYLEALHDTGYYYAFIGLSQLLIALLLLIPRTSFLGTLLYFPVILNICVLAHAVRFEGTRITSFMLLANVYLLCWDYDRIKCLVSSKPVKVTDDPAGKKPLSNKFPFLFFGAVVATIAAIIVANIYLYDIRPGNSAEECINGCPGNRNPKACEEFCDCMYGRGKSLHECLEGYEQAKEMNR